MIAGASLRSALDGSGHRATGPRRAVAELIAAQPGHFTAADLAAAARARGLRIGRATIFRALDLFVALGLVERIELPAGGHGYVACEPAHHHHVVCSRCGRTADVGDLGLADVAREVGRRTGYRIDTHRFELYGVCPACAGASEDAGGSATTSLGVQAGASAGREGEPGRDR
jgi:Fur family ferric uptake transcriptional regulator